MPKRYSQFQTMFRHFYTAEQLINTYGYGCYCLNLGDRPLAGILAGVYPVDAKDKHCFEFTRCNRCVTFDFGPDCTPEQTDYNVSVTRPLSDIGLKYSPYYMGGYSMKFIGRLRHILAG